MNSSICLLGSVSATRFGIMKGTFDDGLPSASSTRPVGSFSLISNVLASSAVIAVDEATSSSGPSKSFAAQRLIEATMSSAVTGVSSCHIRPSRSVMVHVSLSS